MTTATGVVSGVSVSHRHASVGTIEAVGVRDERAAVEALLDHDAVREAFVIETCHRVEAYVVGRGDGDEVVGADVHGGHGVLVAGRRGPCCVV